MSDPPADAVGVMHPPRETDPDEGRTQLERTLAAMHAQSFAWAMACCAQDAADAEDALQTAYLKVLDGKARFGGRSSFRTWLFGVIRRTAAEERRRRWWMGRVGSADTLADGAKLPDASVEEGERAERLRQALKELPRRQQEILGLVFYHEMTIEEAGEVIGVTVGTARTHYERGKKNLLKKLGDVR